MTTANELVERACAALRAVAQAPPAADVSRALADDLEDAWAVEPLRVSATGDARTLIGAVIGVALATPAAPERRAASVSVDDDWTEGELSSARGCARIVVRRGAVERFRATRASGVEELVRLPAPAAPPAVDRSAVDRTAEAAAREAAALPRYLRERPPWWAFWAWIARWVALARGRERLAEWKRLEAARVDVERDLEHASGERAELVARAAVLARTYPDRLAELAASADVTELAVEVVDRLPEGVELVDGDTAGDAVVSVRQRVVFAIDLHATGETPDRARRIGGVDDAARELATIARDGRARRLVWRAIETLRSAEALIGDIVASADARFRGRIAELEALHVDDRPALVATQLAALRPEIIARASAIVKHVLAQVGAELDRIDAAWTHEVTETTTAEALQAAANRVDQQSPAQLDEVVLDARRLLASSLAGCAFDLGRQAAAVLVERGLPESRIRDLGGSPAAMPILGKLADAQGAALGAVTGGWLTGLFKSFDARRSEALAKLRARITELRDVANAELLDIEPQLYAMLGELLERALGTALERYGTWLGDRIAVERAAIATEREAILPLIRARDDAHDDARRLAAGVAAL